MLKGIHHVIISTTRSNADEFAATCMRAGMLEGDRGQVIGTGHSNRTVIMENGSFLEFLYSDDSDATNDPWFADAPRIVCFGFCSTDLAADARAWEDAPGAWTRRFERTSDGITRSSDAAGPIPVNGGFYFFAIDRPHGKYMPRQSLARLSRISLRVPDEDTWTPRLVKWLQLQAGPGERLHRGSVEVVIQQAMLAEPEISIAVEAPVTEPVSIKLARGQFEIVPFAS